MSKKQHIIERTIYPELVEMLKSLEFSDVLGESKVGQNRSYTDITFSYKNTKFLAEIKFGDIDQNYLKPKVFGQTFRYANQKKIENYLILVYPNELSGHVYLGNKWFTEECISKAIRCYIFTNSWTDGLLISPKKAFQTLKRIYNQEEVKKPALNFIVKQLQEIVKDLNKVNNFANKTNLVNEVVDKLKVFIGISGLEEKQQEKIKEQLVSLSTYLLFNQLLFYRIYRIKVKNNDLKPLEGIEKISQLQEYFNLIEKKGYSAIYSSKILDHLSENQEVIEIINDVIEALQYLRPEIITHDIAGIFFHKLIPFEIRKVLATFYTVPVAADLLAGLALEKFDSSIIDPACGSGTLLVASYKVKEEMYHQLFGESTSEKMHKQFLENEITGYDIMPFAGHLSAMNLAMQNIEQKTDIVRIGSGNSLDLATHFISKSFSEGKGFEIKKFQTHTQNPLTEYMDNIPNLEDNIPMQEVTGALSIDGNKSPFKLTPQDVVIMNPPFSDIEKIAKTSPEMLVKMKKNKILTNIIGNRVNLWAYFLALSDLILKENGIVAAIVPISIAVGGATENIRKFMLSNFTIKFIVKPSNEDRAFSQNAFLKDILIVAKKRNPKEVDKTAIISFKSSVKNMEESKMKNILDELQKYYANNKIDSFNVTKDYEIKIVSSKELSKNISNLMPFFISSEITNFVKQLRESGKEVFRKINSKDMHEGYHFSPVGTSNVMCITNPIHPSRIIQGALLVLKKIKKNTLMVEIKGTNISHEIPISNTTNFVRTITGVKKFVVSSLDYALLNEPGEFEKIITFSKWDVEKNGPFDWKNHSVKLKKSKEYVYIPRVFRPDSNNTHNFALFSPKKFIAPHTFKALVCKDSDEGMFQTLLLNSSFGITQLLMYRSQATGGKSDINEHAFHNFDIFDISKLSEKQKSKLKELFSKIEKIDFPSIKEQYQLNNKYRRTLDSGILDILGIDKSKIEKMLDIIYKVIPNELKVD
jgi:hypothetical protein